MFENTFGMFASVAQRVTWGGFVGLIVTTLCVFTLYAFVAAKNRRADRRFPGPTLLLQPDAASDFFVVYLIPCLNEERVIGRTLEHLIRNQHSSSYSVLVIDDGSDDATSEVVEALSTPQVRLFRRMLPDARKGKGAALNAAYRYLCTSEGARTVLGDRPSDRVIVAVLDADGRLRPDATSRVVPTFANDEVGAVQIGVRIGNVASSLLARFQDVEFVVFTEIFQRARRRIGTVGLGGNGQYVRLAALRSLGENPWSDCLTEDLELGIRIRLAGWAGEYVGSTWVEQQGVVSLKKLIRQRTRWFQGHLQCLRLIPSILRSNLGFAAMTDLCWHLASPVVILLMSVTTVPFLLSIVVFAITHRASLFTQIGNHWAGLALFYAMSFLPSYVYAAVYRSRTPGLTRRAAVGIAHLFVVYGFLWIVSGWSAVARVVRKRSSWSKTERSMEIPVATEPTRVAA